ncbi:MAG TPA: ADP-forming succinate--CoA ligase subunit beta [Polyangia bacterium]|jgi:succinyl-CoA synthetase beta subunit|nr:ADP-forming succinate--CoA ligase subunit beta [Polyangia bacterium]
MKIHEYQGKALLAKYGVPVPKGTPAFSVDEAEAAAKALIAETGGEVVVVKAQIHAGGRGKGGGVKVVKGVAAAREAAQKIFGMQLVTHQTGPAGQKVKRLLVEQGADIARELYLGVVVDRGAGRVVVMASQEGGMEIEEVAAKTPEKILKEFVDPVVGLAGYQARNLAYGLGLKGDAAKNAASLLLLTYKAFVELDASLLEVNPLVVLKDNRVLALDAKVTFDDNALYRHKDLEALRDLDEEDAAEVEAKKYDLSFITLDGNVGCMVNGAGLAMATMDTIKHFGGQPANFLDVGGGATAEKVTAAFKIITHDPKVKGIFVNIFGGIMKCDTIAEGVITAVKQVGLKVPLVVRLEGTNVELGKKLLAESGLPITTAGDMADGAQKIVALVKTASAGSK